MGRAAMILHTNILSGVCRAANAGIPGVPHDPFAPRRGPLGPSPDMERAIETVLALGRGPLARL